MLGAEPEGAGDLRRWSFGWAQPPRDRGRARRRDHQRALSGADADPGPRCGSKTRSNETLFGYEWQLSFSVAGAHQRHPDGRDGEREGVPGRPRPVWKSHPPVMLTTGPRAAKRTPGRRSRSRAASTRTRTSSPTRSPGRGVEADPPRHGPVARATSGPEVPAERRMIWQDPVPELDHELPGADDIAELKRRILASGLTVAQLCIDRVGVGVYVPRHGQARRRQRRPHPPGPQKDWQVNDPAELATVPDPRRIGRSGTPRSPAASGCCSRT